MISLFIDANVYLHFYAYSDDDLIELDKLSALVEADELKIYKNEQLEDEIERNREKKISEALATFKKSGGPVQIPRFARHFDKADELIKLSKELQQSQSELASEVSDQINKGQLKADQSIRELLAKAEPLEIDAKVLDAARKRQIRGNPPGKPGSIGDQIHWESLLQKTKNGEDLHLVSRDADFASLLNPSEPNPKLLSEWNKAKDGVLHIYDSLGSFVGEHFAAISLPSDAKKVSAIAKLVSSTNFENTHKQIGRLKNLIDEITFDEANLIFQAMIDNNQIHWVAEDPDVKAFYKPLIDKYWLEIDNDTGVSLAKIASYLDPIPF